ncbi:MAG: ATP-dependent endonuclease [Morganella sp. (in: enterobacteria)]
MILERVEILGFRGINRLSLLLTNNTVLIGENAWGKSSLLDALTLTLSPQAPAAQFIPGDFYHSPDSEDGPVRHLQIVLVFRENRPGRSRSRRFRDLAPLWRSNGDEYQRINYRVSADLADDNTISSQRTFLDEQGEPLPLDDADTFIREIIRLYPVLRLRDARFMHKRDTCNVPDCAEGECDTQDRAEAFNEQMAELTQALVNNPHALSDDDLQDGLEAMKQLLSHYFAEEGEYLLDRRKAKRLNIEPRQRAWHALEGINRVVAGPNQRNVRLIILAMFAALLQSNSGLTLDPYARPIIIVEDPETRLHPIMLSVAWGLLSLFSLQRITTTNSGELLSLVSIHDICRLVRKSNRVAAYRLGENHLSPEELRRISFHIRINRPSALFARCWLLVEGETEIWLMNDLAKQCHYYFETEGIKVVEFAQCGLKPLLKFANKMGIEWHTLVDGDEAGKKYAATATHFSSELNDVEQDRLTRLPAPDMEHFLYRNGFSGLYHQIAGIPEDVRMPVRRIIIKAIHRASKPDLAIAVANNAAGRGVESIPLLLRQMFSRVAWLARGRAN